MLKPVLVNWNLPGTNYQPEKPISKPNLLMILYTNTRLFFGI
ncbi:MAG: hypothetical protein US85_C0012G0039, partial [Candidatus Shapirobacteria bacterium GW2011_GWF1_38_23]